MVVGVLDHNGGQYCQYGLILSCRLVIIQDARPEIGEAPLTLISQMRQLACHLLFHLECWPISCL